MRFRFKGKSGKQHDVGLRDRRLATVVRRCRDLPGQELFQYVDDEGIVRDVSSDDVNAYLRDAGGGDFTAKDFRTWAGTVLAYRALQALEPGEDERTSRRHVVEAMRSTSEHLGNTPAVARGSYVHPAVIDAYLDGSIGGALVEAAEDEGDAPTPPTPAEEAEVMRLLRDRLAADARRSTGAGRRRRSHRARAGSGSSAR